MPKIFEQVIIVKNLLVMKNGYLFNVFVFILLTNITKRKEMEKGSTSHLVIGTSPGMTLKAHLDIFLVLALIYFQYCRLCFYMEWHSRLFCAFQYL